MPTLQPGSLKHLYRSRGADNPLPLFTALYFPSQYVAASRPLLQPDERHCCYDGSGGIAQELALLVCIDTERLDVGRIGEKWAALLQHINADISTCAATSSLASREL